MLWKPASQNQNSGLLNHQRDIFYVSEIRLAEFVSQSVSDDLASFKFSYKVEP